MNIFRNCQDINLAALQLALSKTEPRTLERYYLTGRQMTLGEDIVAATGPDWLDGPGLQFNSVLLCTVQPTCKGHRCKVFLDVRSVCSGPNKPYS